jgi:acetolactate synthase small subunit
MKITEAASERHVLAVMVDNEPGILAKITGLFTARGYNIDSLTVADITEDHAVSRITIVTNGPPSVIDQIEAQLERLVPVHKVTDLTTAGPHVERELALIKVAGQGSRCIGSLSSLPPNERRILRLECVPTIRLQLKFPSLSSLLIHPVRRRPEYGIQSFRL